MYQDENLHRGLLSLQYVMCKIFILVHSIQLELRNFSEQYLKRLLTV